MGKDSTPDPLAIVASPVVSIGHMRRPLWTRSSIPCA